MTGAGSGPHLLLDTHVLVRWLVEPEKLSRDQIRELRGSIRRCEPFALSAITLIEVAVVSYGGRKRTNFSVQEILAVVDENAGFRIIPIDVVTAREVAALGDALRDPGDRVIVATARVHRLRLVTSDQRIIDSRLVPVVE